MEEPEASEAAAGGVPDWRALPNGVLQLIFHLASTWQKPGSCLAARVCSSWRAAAAGCRDIQLLYCTGLPEDPADLSFAAWLRQSGHQLGALTLIGNTFEATDMLLCALAEASSPPAAAAAPADLAAVEGGAGGTAGAGGSHPLPLHTLCVLWWGPSLQTIRRLLPALPNVRCLQLSGGIDERNLGLLLRTEDRWQEPFVALKQAKHLRELHLEWPYLPSFSSQAAASLLPLRLERLTTSTLQGHCSNSPPDLSHLMRLTFLRLLRGRHRQFATDMLPAGLQGLDMADVEGFACLPVERPELVVGVQPPGDWGRITWGNTFDLSSLSKLRMLHCTGPELCSSAVRTALPQLTALSALTVFVGRSSDEENQCVVSTAASIHGLRRLEVLMDCSNPVLPGLSQVTGLTRLALSAKKRLGSASIRAAWAAELGQMVGLRWLQVPDGLLVVPGEPWLADLKQLQVLEVYVQPRVDAFNLVGRKTWERCRQRVAQWLEGDQLRAVSPQLRLLMVTKMPPDQAAPLQLRSRLRQLVGSSGCEVVVGMVDPTQQLAPLPEALQQALE